ncbi:uncharacterized protein [Bemisia tabaci]|uniref:uncharacterized protein n=1 Tax=Bemisia tabaci TaxID=7038 RepID=UPI003B288836
MIPMVAYVHKATLLACGDLGLFPTRMMLHNASMYCWQAFDTLHKLGGKFEEPECRHFFEVPACRRRGPFRTYKCTVPVRRNRFTRIPYFGDNLALSRVETTTLTYCARPIINLNKNLEREEKVAKRKKKKL